MNDHDQAAVDGWEDDREYPADRFDHPAGPRAVDVCAELAGTEPDDDTDGPGPWITAGFDGPCSHGDTIVDGDMIRADGDGGWEHRECAVSLPRSVPDGMTRRTGDYVGWMEGDQW
jgi:hypothetical protein